MNNDAIYQTVTDTIIKLLETQLESWNRPWIAFGADNDYARNAQSKAYYKGINQFILSFMLLGMGYPKNAWLTFRQVEALGGRVIKGEKSSPVIFYKTGYVDKDNGFHSAEQVEKMPTQAQSEQGIKKVPILRLYHLFNVSQTEGLAPSFYEVTPMEPLCDMEKDDRAEALMVATNADIEIVKGNRASYDPIADKIRVPLREQFRGVSEHFYATVLHELGHWSGHSSRLNRDMNGVFGDASYSREEMVAELCAAFCGASLGFSKGITQNAAYIKSWLAILKQDNKAVVRASYQAQKAADYILAFRPA